MKHYIETFGYWLASFDDIVAAIGKRFGWEVFLTTHDRPTVATPAYWKDGVRPAYGTLSGHTATPSDYEFALWPVYVMASKMIVRG